MNSDWNREHITVKYKGVDITDKIGLCVCNNCTTNIRKKIDSNMTIRMKEKIKEITKNLISFGGSR